MTILEVVMSLAVVSIGAMSALSCLVTTWSVDEELRERSIALRAASTAMEGIVAFDHGGDIQNLLTFYADPDNATFVVDDLVPAGAAIADAGTGTITVDGTDPDRVRVTIRVDWQGRKGARSISLPLTLTELTP